MSAYYVPTIVLEYITEKKKNIKSPDGAYFLLGKYEP